ncbi:MAG: response regulator [Firmicutes bacterium]|nr:response regulator [Bacillota bacterium]
MSNVYFTSLALSVSVILTVIFFIKKTENEENKILKLLLYLNIIESSVSLITSIFLVSPGSIFFLKFLKKMDVIIVLLWSALLTYYISAKIIKNTELTKKILIVGSCILGLTSIFFKVNINSLGYFTGSILIFEMLGIIIFDLFIIYILYLSKDKLNEIDENRFKILNLIIILMAISSFLKVSMLEINFMSMIISVISMITIFTIENPEAAVVEALTRENKEVEKNSKAKSNVLVNLSHELRTPLNSIIGFTEDIKKFESNVDHRIVEDTDYILESSKTLLQLIDDIMDITTIEANMMNLNNTNYNFRNEIINSTKDIPQKLISKNVQFKLLLSDEIPFELTGDIEHIKQIISNLLTNSIKYTDEGEINLTVKCVNNINLCTLMIEVSDTGQGIEADNIQKLFTKYERLDKQQTSASEGIGLGLAITKYLVDLMNGKIEVQSDLEKGSIFRVQIPQKISKLNNPNGRNFEMPQDAIYSSVETISKRILIVDDNILNIKVARRALDEFNYNIDECESGQECLMKIKDGEKYDLILMDIMMPNMSGEETLQKLQEIEGFNTPVIALTADAISGSKEKYLREGFKDYISKPFTKEEIKEKLDKIFKF